MEIEKYIEERWSPRAFDSKPLENDTLKEIFEAGGRAASSFNEQPWTYIIGQKGSKSYNKLFECMNEWNQSWAKTAPVLALGVIKKTFSKNGNPNHHAAHDLGAASATLTMKAFEKNIFIHQMAGILPDKAKEIFNIPEGYEVKTMLAIGYQGDKNQLPEDIAKQENGPSDRKDLNEFVFHEKWDESAF